MSAASAGWEAAGRQIQCTCPGPHVSCSHASNTVLQIGIDINDVVHRVHYWALHSSGLMGRSRDYNTTVDNPSFQMKLKITITGLRVHDVGYLPWLTEKAVDLDLRGFEVYNDAEGDQQSVVALVNSDNRRATQFFQFAQAELPPLARVDAIRSEPYDEEIQPLWQSATLGTFVQINKAVPILQEMRGDLREVKNEYESHPGDREEYPDHPEITEKQDVIIDEIRGRGLYREMTFDAGWRARIESDIQAIKAKIGIK